MGYEIFSVGMVFGFILGLGWGIYKASLDAKFILSQREELTAYKAEVAKIVDEVEADLESRWDWICDRYSDREMNPFETARDARDVAIAAIRQRLGGKE